MAESRTKRTGEHDADVLKLAADSAMMRERLAALEARVAMLEAEVSALRGGAAASTATPSRPGSASATIARPSKRPPAPSASTSGGRMPPPLPPGGGMPVGTSRVAMPPSAKGGRRSVVDISEIAELVESMPPPPHSPRK